MTNDQSDAPGVIAVIPARGGSKGLPRKNVRLLGGKPLIVWSIEAALGARHVARTCVSTEDAEIAEVARNAGAEVIMRPERLAQDHVQNNDVVRHVLETVGVDRYRDLALLQPTSPLRTAEHLDGAIEAYRQAGARTAMTVAPVEHHPGKSVVLSAAGLVEPFTTLEDMERRRQEMIPCFRQNGAVYLVSVADFLTLNRFYLPPCAGYRMTGEESVDIDCELDLALAELLVRRREAATGRLAA
jgi:CMP-N,N'-diacetyllegionaminic acid synthase